jgi:hypothetical protein
MPFDIPKVSWHLDNDFEPPNMKSEMVSISLKSRKLRNCGAILDRFLAKDPYSNEVILFNRRRLKSYVLIYIGRQVYLQS